MKKYLIVVLLLSVMLGGCATTKLSSSWSKPDYSGSGFKKIMVVGVFDDDLHRRLYEDAFVNKLSDYGVQAVASHTLVPKLYAKDKKAQNKKLLEQAVVKSGADGVLIASLAGVDTEEYTTPSSVSFIPRYNGYYGGGMYGYYGYSYSVVHHPGYHVENKTFKLRTALFSSKKEEMVWAGQTDSLNPDSADEIVNDNVNLISAQIKKEKFI